jgi:hypothetical protein
MSIPCSTIVNVPSRLERRRSSGPEYVFLYIFHHNEYCREAGEHEIDAYFDTSLFYPAHISHEFCLERW